MINIVKLAMDAGLPNNSPAGVKQANGGKD
jgi:hypothetical protein